MNIHLYQNDLPDDLSFDHITQVAIDTETTGLNIGRDRLCVVQLCFGDDVAHLIQFKHRGNPYDAPNLKRLLTNGNIQQLFHFARFDVAVLEHFFNIQIKNIFCTKIASKLARTSTDRHGLKDLARDLIKIEISKQQQTSDWGSESLSEEQLKYAAGDVLYLHELYKKLNMMLIRENRIEMAQACFDFLPTRARFDLLKWDENKDIFAHS